MSICRPNPVGLIGEPHGPTTETFLVWILPLGCQGYPPRRHSRNSKAQNGLLEAMNSCYLCRLKISILIRPRPSVNPTMRNMSPPPGLSGFESPRERNIVDRLDLHPSPTPSKRSRSNSTGSHRARGMDRETAHRGNPSARGSGRGRSGDPASIIGRDPLNADTLVNVLDGIEAFQGEFNRSSGMNAPSVHPTPNAASIFALSDMDGANVPIESESMMASSSSYNHTISNATDIESMSESRALLLLTRDLMFLCERIGLLFLNCPWPKAWA